MEILILFFWKRDDGRIPDKPINSNSPDPSLAIGKFTTDHGYIRSPRSDTHLVIGFKFDVIMRFISHHFQLCIHVYFYFNCVHYYESSDK